MVNKIVKAAVIGSAIGAVVMMAECGMKTKQGMRFGRKVIKAIGL